MITENLKKKASKDPLSTTDDMTKVHQGREFDIGFLKDCSKRS